MYLTCANDPESETNNETTPRRDFGLARDRRSNPSRRTAEATARGRRRTSTAAEAGMPPGTPAEQVKTLIGQWDAGYAEFLKRFQAAKSGDEQEKMMPLRQDANDYAAVLIQVAERHPKDPAAFDALIWIVTNGRPSSLGKQSPFAKAITILTRDYILDPRIGPLCRALSVDEFDPESIPSLRDLMAKNPSKSVQALAHYARAVIGSAGFVRRILRHQSHARASRWLGKRLR